MGNISIHRIAADAIYQRKLSAIQFIRKGIPAARAVQSSGTITSKIGSLFELQPMARRAATGISQSSAKLAKFAPPEKPRKKSSNAYNMSGTSTGRLTISTNPKSQRENPKPPGLTMLPRKN